MNRALGWFRRLPCGFACILGACSGGHREQVGRIEIVFAGNADQSEQRITPGVAQRRTHPVWRGDLADRANRPVRGDPFSGGMRQQRRQPNLARCLVNPGPLDRGDLVLTQTLAHNVQPAG